MRSLAAYPGHMTVRVSKGTETDFCMLTNNNREVQTGTSSHVERELLKFSIEGFLQHWLAGEQTPMFGVA